MAGSWGRSHESEWSVYVPVAERRKQAEKEVAALRKKGRTITPVTLDGKKIASTFWGKAWCDALESYSDYANRLPRGRSYVRNGSIVHLCIADGTVEALVRGTRLVEVHRLAGERHKLHLLAAELGSGGRRLPGRGRRAERRVALCRRRLTVVVVVVVGDVAFARPADKPSPCKVASDAAHRAVENSPDLACRQVRERVKDHRVALLSRDPVEKENVQVRSEAQIRACTMQSDDSAALAPRHPRLLHASGVEPKHRLHEEARERAEERGVKPDAAAGRGHAPQSEKNFQREVQRRRGPMRHDPRGLALRRKRRSARRCC